MTEFLNKYSQLCDKYHHLYINIGSKNCDNIFTTKLNNDAIINYIKICEKLNFPIIKNTKGHISVYNNEYHYNDIDDFNIIEYNTIDTSITNNILYQFLTVKYNNNTSSYNIKPNNEYDYELIVIQIIEGCNIEIMKIYNNNGHYYKIYIVMYKPCTINKYLNLLLGAQ